MLSNHVGTTNSFDSAELHFNVQFHSHDLHIVVMIRPELFSYLNFKQLEY